MKIYLCIEYYNVGDEHVHMATTDKNTAMAWKRYNNKKTETRNFDVIDYEDGVELER